MPEAGTECVKCRNCDFVSIETEQFNTQSFADISCAFSVTVSLLWFTLKSITKQAVCLFLSL